MDEKTLTEVTKILANSIEKLPFNIFNQPPIIESILKFLPAKDLFSCAKVCSSWNAVAKDITSKRKSIFIIPKYEDNIPRAFLDLCNKPSLAICFGPSRFHLKLNQNVCQMIRDILRLVGDEARRNFPVSQSFAALLEEAQNENIKLRNYLPTGCTLFHLLSESFHLYDPRACNAHSPIMALIPSIKGVEIQPFIVSDWMGKKIGEDFFLSERVITLKSIIKCVVVFTDIKDTSSLLNTNMHTTPSIRKYITEESVIIEGDSYFHTTTGIAFSGEKIQVECVSLNGKECCIKQYFSILTEFGFNKERGIAFLVDRTEGVYALRDRMSLGHLWCRFFPTIFIVGTARKIRYCSPFNRTFSSLQSCNECGAQLNASNFKEEPIVIVFILFKDIMYEVIND